MMKIIGAYCNFKKQAKVNENLELRPRAQIRRHGNWRKRYSENFIRFEVFQDEDENTWMSPSSRRLQGFMMMKTKWFSCGKSKSGKWFNFWQLLTEDKGLKAVENTHSEKNYIHANIPRKVYHSASIIFPESHAEKLANGG